MTQSSLGADPVRNPEGDCPGDVEVIIKSKRETGFTKHAFWIGVDC
jgi:hypothetical protein